MSREEWEVLRGDKTPKHTEYVDFEFSFEVVSYESVLNNTTYDITIYTKDENSDKLLEHIHTLNNVSVVQFNGNTEKGVVVVTNDLIESFVAAKKEKDGRLYWYFYLHENSEYIRLADNIWITKSQLKELNKKFDYFGIMPDKNLKQRSEGGII